MWYVTGLVISLALKIMKIRVEVGKSIELDLDSETNLYMSNHASILEIFTIMWQKSHMVSFIAKHSLFKIPLIGTALRIGHSLPINRENLSEAKQNLTQAEENILTRRDVVVFPEGRRRRNSSMNG